MKGGFHTKPLQIFEYSFFKSSGDWTQDFDWVCQARAPPLELHPQTFCFWDRVLLTLPGLPLNWRIHYPPASAPWVDGITGMYHQLAWIIFLVTKMSMTIHIPLLQRNTLGKDLNIVTDCFPPSLPRQRICQGIQSWPHQYLQMLSSYTLINFKLKKMKIR
jgi:hypothetical protein